MPHKDPEKRRAYDAARYVANREKWRGYNAAYYAAHREKLREYAMHYRASTAGILVDERHYQKRHRGGG